MNVEKLFWDFYKAPVENEVESDLDALSRQSQHGPAA